LYSTGPKDLLERYSDCCLPLVWRAQRFSWWMTAMFHRSPGQTPFEYRRQLAELDYVSHSPAATAAPSSGRSSPRSPEKRH